MGCAHRLIDMSAMVGTAHLKGIKMEYEENYYVFVIISCIAGFWHAFTIFFILHFQLIGILFALISILMLWSLKKFAEWLYKPTPKRNLLKILLLSEGPFTLIFVILLFLLKYKLT